ncbi:MAG: 1-deoxy-D-xylulose-5-phosphate reductoisomerase [Lachnospiraceae bacterium]|nr:1-deoxy-D-xylulose-5-phosphate reductoisomerase [Lachnospiraceae bacterium]
MKKISVLGSTGSIGTQTMDIVRDNPGKLGIAALAAGSNIDLLEKQIREFKPAMAAIYDEDKYTALKERVSDLDVRISAGMEGIIEAATLEDAECVVTSMVGMIGIRPTIAAINAGKDIALANKETLVCAGHIIMPLAEKNSVRILPVDSEHSAIFQSMNGENKKRIEKILLTASGGPFRGKSAAEIRDMKVEDALKHPNWSMGRKITVDSATLVNKGLEVMEARWLFDVPLDKIRVVVHPQSIIHSMVEYVDGAIIAQLGMPDMKLPIQYALFYPDRRYLKTDRVDFFALKEMTFEKPDTDTFRGLELAMEAARAGGTMPTVFNAANERAVALFLDRRIGFTQIYDIIEACMEAHEVSYMPDVDTILETEKNTYAYIDGRWK